MKSAIANLEWAGASRAAIFWTAWRWGLVRWEARALVDGLRADTEPRTQFLRRAGLILRRCMECGEASRARSMLRTRCGMDLSGELPGPLRTQAKPTI